MKKLFSILLAVSPSLIMAQVNYKIEGEIGALNAPAKAVLMYSFKGETKKDSVGISNGKFILEGSIPENLSGTLYVIHDGINSSERASRKDVKRIYLENGTIKLTSDDSLKNTKISGGTVNLAQTTLDEKKKPINDALSKLVSEYREQIKGPDSVRKEEILASTQKKYKEISKGANDIDQQFIKENPNNYYSYVLLQSLSYDLSNSEVESIFEALSPTLKSTTAGVAMKTKIEARKNVEVGKLAPEFTAPDTLEKDFALSSLRGKYVLIDFWASWCGPCRAENPNVVDAFNKYKSKNFTVLGVSLDQPGKKEDWIKAIEKDGLQGWPQVSDLKGWQTEIGKLYAIDAIPQNFLLDPQGVIVATNLREKALHEKLAELLK